MLKAGIIISIQPTPLSLFDSIDRICDFARIAEQACAIAVKIEGIKRIEAVKRVISIPLIGISKIGIMEEGRFPITPTIQLLDLIFDTGADYAATESLAVIEASNKRSRLIFEADAEATSKIAQDFGVMAIATTLYGYTKETEDRFSPDPDLEAVSELHQALAIPIVAEGRYSKSEDIRAALECGAHSVCIGTAITRPDIMIQNMVKAFRNEEALRHS